MNFEFSAEQEMLRDTARAMLANANCIGIAHARTLGADAPAGVAAGLDDSALWAQMARLGWLGLPFPAEYGGDEREFLDLAVLLEEMGRAVAPPAYTSTVVTCGLTLLRHAGREQRAAWLPRIVDGSARMALVAPAATSGGGGAGAITLRRDEGALVLDGCVPMVEEAARSDAFLVAASEAGSGAPALLLVESTAPGLALRPRRTVSGERADVELRAVRVSADAIVAADGAASAALAETALRGAVAACLDMVGAGDAILELVTAYVAERVQFGKPVGSFQAVQHHAANMAVDNDASRLITYEAAWKLGAGLDARMEVAMAKAWTSRAYRRVATLGHQLFGGIGLMREHDMHLFMRRGRRDALAFGDATHHLDELAAILEAQGTPWPE